MNNNVITIQQNEQYNLPINVHVGDTVITPEDCTNVIVQLGEYTKDYLSGTLLWDDEAKLYLFPLTSDMTDGITKTVSWMFQVGIEIGEDYVLSDVQTILVRKSIIGNIKPIDPTDYNDLKNKPTINNIVLQGNITTEELGLTNYGNLTNKPSINGIELVGDVTSADLGIIDNTVDDLVNYYLKSETYTKAEVADIINAITYSTLTNKPQINGVTLNGNKTTTDLDLMDNTVNDLVNYYLKSDTYTKDEVLALISTISATSFESVETLPTEDIKTNVIYLVPKSSAEPNDIKNEYINLNGTTEGWELIGSTSIDLTQYVRKTELSNADFNVTNNNISLQPSQRTFTGTTQEWNDLSSEEKALYGTVQLTDDDDANYKDVYSTSEVKTNKVWIDGKPIYRRVWHGNLGSGTGENILEDLSGWGMDNVVHYDGTMHEGAGNWICDQPVGSYLVGWYITGYKLKENHTQSAYNGKESWVTIEYTKTTDG